MDELKEILKNLEKPIPERKPLEIIVEKVIQDVEEKENSTINVLKSRTDFERLLMLERQRWVQVVNLLIKAYTQKCDHRDQTKNNFRIDGENFVCHRGNIFYQDQLITAEELINVAIKNKELDRLYENVSRYFQLEEVGALSDLRNALVSLRSYQRRLESQGMLILESFKEYRDQLRLLEQWKLSNKSLLFQFFKNLSWWQLGLTIISFFIFGFSICEHWM